MTETKKLTLKLKLPTAVPIIKPKKEVIILKASIEEPKVIVKQEERKTSKTPLKEPLKKLLLPQEEYKKLFEELCANYPNLFDIKNKRVRILASGIHLQVREELGWSAKTTRNFFAIFCHAKKYKKMCVKGAKRYDLQGKVIGEVE